MSNISTHIHVRGRTNETEEHTVSSTKWSTSEAQELSTESVKALLHNEIPAIRIPDFATAAECEQFSAAAKASSGVRAYSVDVPTSYIGIVVYEYRQGEGRKDEFFEEAPQAIAALEAIYADSFDAPARFMDLLGKYYDDGDVKVAHEPGFGDYCPTVARIANNGVHLHADFAAFNAPGWAIGDISQQITWNLYAQRPKSGGETTVFNAPWTPKEGEDPAKGLPSLDVLERDDVERFTFAPKEGEVVLFNPRNPHMIAAGSTEEGAARVTIGSFLGRTPSGDLIMFG
jgi:hypothetical protein